MQTPDLPHAAPRRGPGFPEFVALIAMMMALNALAIDSMLPALPAIGDALNVASENSRQWVITAYLLGFGVAQLIYGPLADRYGRKPVLMAGLALYVLFSVAAAFTTTFEALILARLGTGLGAAALRVLAVSIVRDRYQGRTMARVMSLSFLVFLGVPILAPTLGQLILLVAPWRWIFGVLALAGSGFMLWALIRLPETLAPENRLPIQVSRITEAFRAVVSDRLSVGYTLAMTAITGSLFAFINSSQQIFFDVFGQPELFTTVFGLMAGGIAVASLTNARLVERLGSRRLSHIALIGFISSAGIHAAVALSGHESLISFAVLQGLTMFCFGFIAGNFGALAMNNMGRIAGTASSVQGFVSTTFGSLAGFLIGQQFNGTAAPMTIGITLCGILALTAVLVAERGRLFSTQEAESAPA
ncbi:multidrug effflux MFS transporter [Brevundimonas sp. A19_0]|uniref:multidrug effflux MFS transporter n=1 Tax=Brevundimonas sp. A19_0 TaxID=2821087 RepID=UPI001ADA999A|nr:multidrug effflux MFS transporter [Brevundimonas sp. A19_0]MBO9501133.1 multidrug effflux MFS transporter [Brevundimonas sp. A19_0]